MMLSSSDCESRPLRELLELEVGSAERLLEMRLGYTEVPGAPELRAAAAGLYEHAGEDDVLVLAAAEEGILLAYHALLAPGDRAVVEAPCYGSAAEVVPSTGAALDLWERSFQDGWRHDPERLRAALTPRTRMLYINSPHNPTGLQMPREVFDAVIEIARERELVVLSDEVYRGLEHDPALRLPAACDVYERAISLGTVSKAHGLPGLRLGWIACRDPELLRAVRELKLYTTICSSAPSELLVALALRHGEQIVERNRRLVLENLPLLDDFIARRGELFRWRRPDAGPIGFPRIVREDLDVHRWCEQIAEQAGVLLLPGSVYGQPRHVRLGFGRANLPQALARLDEHLG